MGNDVLSSFQSGLSLISAELFAELGDLSQRHEIGFSDVLAAVTCIQCLGSMDTRTIAAELRLSVQAADSILSALHTEGFFEGGYFHSPRATQYDVRVAPKATNPLTAIAQRWAESGGEVPGDFALRKIYGVLARAGLYFVPRAAFDLVEFYRKAFPKAGLGAFLEDVFEHSTQLAAASTAWVSKGKQPLVNLSEQAVLLAARWHEARGSTMDVANFWEPAILGISPETLTNTKADTPWEACRSRPRRPEKQQKSLLYLIDQQKNP